MMNDQKQGDGAMQTVPSEGTDLESPVAIVTLSHSSVHRSLPWAGPPWAPATVEYLSGLVTLSHLNSPEMVIQALTAQELA